jgi:8-amino-7-oxononanoate synthase
LRLSNFFIDFFHYNEGTFMDVLDIVENEIAHQYFCGIDQVDAQKWDSVVPRATGLRYNVLKSFEKSKINDLVCHYMLFNKGDELIGKANLYEVSMDFASIDQNMSSEAKNIIKHWHPNFLNLSMIECGLFAMNGDGVVVKNAEQLSDVILQIDKKFNAIAHEKNLDLLVYRDIPLEQYAIYEKLLVPLGYMPVAGFSNAVIDINWNSLDEYLKSVNSKDRYKLKKSLKIEQEFDIRIEITSNYKHLAGEMARLWSNVNASSEDYNREQLDEAFFYQSGLHLNSLSEAILFYSGDKLVAFMWNLIGEEDYHMADWGVDYDFPQYKQANFYRAASIYSLKRAIELRKRRMQLGMTNYTPKKLLGAEMQPLVYFIKHKRNPAYSSVVARMITDALEQPDILNYYSPNCWPVSNMTPEDYKKTINNKVIEFGSEDAFASVEANYDIDILKLGNLYSFYPDTDVVDIQLSHPTFLQLGENPLVIEAGVQALRLNGSVNEGAPFFTGASGLTINLQEKIAQLLHKESAQVLSSGSLMHVAVLPSLLNAETLVLMDEQNGPLLWEAVGASGAEVKVFGHSNMEHLESLLAECADRKKIIITEAIFSLFGDCCDLKKIVQLKEQYSSRLYLDESHSFGLFGASGEGLAGSLGLSTQVDIIAASTLPALGIEGGFFAAGKRVIEHIRHNSTTCLFSAGLSVASLTMMEKALNELGRCDILRKDLLQNTEHLVSNLTALGFTVVNHGIPVINVIMSDFMILLAVQKKLLNAGVTVAAIGQPILPPDMCVLRMSLHSQLSRDHINQVIDQFREISAVLKLN